MKLRKILVVAVVSGVALATGGWLLQREAAPEGSVYQQARLFEDVLAHVADYYVDSLDERQLYQMAIDGMLDQLHDPYSVFLKRDDFRALSEATTGNYGGLGIQIDVRDGWITVIAPLPDTPAWRGGVEPGDRIVALDGRSTEGWKNDQAVKELRGEPGTKVELRVRRVGLEQPITFKLTRATIHIRSVQVAMLLDDKVGFVQLSPVSETSAAELTHAVDSLVQKGMKSLILDLRYNPGGLLDQGVAVSELFLDPGQEVVSTRGRAPNITRSFKDTKPQPWPGLPIVTLRGAQQRENGDEARECGNRRQDQDHELAFVLLSRAAAHVVDIGLGHHLQRKHEIKAHANVPGHQHAGGKPPIGEEQGRKEHEPEHRP